MASAALLLAYCVVLDLRAHERTGAIGFPGIEFFRVVAAFGVIVFHLWFGLGRDPDLRWLMKLRDCALPFFTLTLAFFITRGVMSRPDRSYAEFARLRTLRLGVPYVAWALIIGALTWSLPWVGWPRLTPWGIATGAFHLWFLLFALLVSLVMFPVIRAASRRGWLTTWFAIGCVAFAVVWLVWMKRPLFQLATEFPFPQVRHFPRRCIAHLVYVPLGVAFAIEAERLRRLLSFKVVWGVAAILTVAAMIAFQRQAGVPHARELYSAAVFLMMIGPFPNALAAAARPLIEQTYAVYAMHVIPLGFARYLVKSAGLTVDAPLLLGLGAVLLAVTAGASMALQKVPGVRWILPTVRVRAARRGPAPSGEASAEQNLPLPPP